MKIRKGTGAALNIIGFLKEIPEINTIKNDKSIATIVLAVDCSKKNASNEIENYTEWFSIVVFGDASLFIKNHGYPGMRLYVEAYVKHEKKEVESKDSKKYYFSIPRFYATEIHPMDTVKHRVENHE